jgi:hypothetical protein
MFDTLDVFVIPIHDPARQPVGSGNRIDLSSGDWNENHLNKSDGPRLKSSDDLDNCWASNTYPVPDSMKQPFMVVSPLEFTESPEFNVTFSQL